MHINQNIKRIRELRGMSQRDLAGLIGEKRSTYAEWERDIVPKADILLKIASALDVTMDEILSENGNRGTLGGQPFNQETKKNQEVSDMGTSLTTLTGLLVQLMTTQNNILSQQKEEIVDRLKRMETNLEFVAGTSESIQFDMISERETVLRSLARIEKKSEEELLVIADKKKRSLAQIKGAPYKKAASSK